MRTLLTMPFWLNVPFKEHTTYGRNQKGELSKDGAISGLGIEDQGSAVKAVCLSH